MHLCDLIELSWSRLTTSVIPAQNTKIFIIFFFKLEKLKTREGI